MFEQNTFILLCLSIVLIVTTSNSIPAQVKNTKDSLNLKFEMKKFCLGKSAKNFCSKDFEKIANSIIDKQKEKIQMENEKLIQFSKLNRIIMENIRLKYLRDFYTLRFF